MTRPADAPVTGDTAFEVCERAGASVLLNGTIAGLGRRYVLGLAASTCDAKEFVAEQQVEVPDREHVLEGLGRLALDVRRRLGDTGANLRRFSVPVVRATTGSLDALKAYSVGEQFSRERGPVAAEPFYRRALDLDPDFAMAHVRLAALYGALGRRQEARERAIQAYERRARVSERERFRIDAMYCSQVVEWSRDPHCSLDVLELYARTYPLDAAPRVNLASAYADRGEYDRALSNALEGLRLDAKMWLAHYNAAAAFVSMNRFADARRIIDAAAGHSPDVPPVHRLRFEVAWLTGDAATVAAERRALERIGWEDSALADEFDFAAFAGRFEAARERSNRAFRITAQAPQVAAERVRTTMLQAAAGLRACDAVPGEIEAQSEPTIGPAASEVAFRLAAALICGDHVRARRLLPRITPDAAIVPVARTLIAIESGSRSAIRDLPAAAPADQVVEWYLRGIAQLAAGDGAAAAVAFQWVVDHRGRAFLTAVLPLCSLAEAQRARAYALAGQEAKARAAYQTFFRLWEHADADVPILVAARTEYARLTSGSAPR